MSIMEKRRVVVTNSFLPAGIKAKNVKAPTGKTASIIKSSRDMGKGEVLMLKNSAIPPKI